MVSFSPRFVQTTNACEEHVKMIALLQERVTTLEAQLETKKQEYELEADDAERRLSESLRELESVNETNAAVCFILADK